MVDIVDKKTRSKMMSGIGSKNTKPEILIRKALFSRGFRYRLHNKLLPGKPDLTFPKYHCVVFVNGCFWHGHQCNLFKWPSTNSEFWKAKIKRNMSVDNRSVAELTKQGWRVLVVWECALKGKGRLPFELLMDRIELWIKKGNQFEEISGRFSDC